MTTTEPVDKVEEVFLSLFTPDDAPLDEVQMLMAVFYSEFCELVPDPEVRLTIVKNRLALCAEAVKVLEALRR